MAKKTILVIDSFALIFRAYYAYPPTLTTSEGKLINAVYGFSSLLLDVLDKFVPTHVIAVFDSASPSIRSNEFVNYKANRKEKDVELSDQIPIVRDVVESFGIPMLEVKGYEADDIIATIHERFSNEDNEVVIVTGDQDLFQLVEKNTSVYLAGKSFSQSKRFFRDDIYAKLGIYPENVADYKGLCGDASDNIPGVKGIGAKTAQNLIASYGDIENIYKNIDAVPNRSKNLLLEGYEIANKSKELATVIRDVPVSFVLGDAKLDSIDFSLIRNKFAEFEFNSLDKKVKKLQEKLAPEDVSEMINDGQTLFSALEESSETHNFSDIKNLEYSDSKNLFVHLKAKKGSQSDMDISFEHLFVFDGENDYKVSSENLRDFVSNIVKNQNIIIGHNIKEFFHSLINLNIEIDKILFEDLGFAVQLLSKGILSHGLDSVLRYLKVSEPDEEYMFTHIYKEVYKRALSDLEKQKGINTIYDIEKKILPAVIKMERDGIELDVEKTSEYEKRLSDLKNEISNNIFVLATQEFNINSPKQVAEILYDKLGIAPRKKTRGGARSTNEQALASMIDDHEIVNLILKYREVDKLLGTYFLPLPKYILEDGRIHSTFDQMGAVSGRFSSKNPNLQNIPVNEDLDVNTRDCFVASKGKTFVAFDYSQQELRILAALAKEESMINAFKNSIDIHALTAANMFNVPIEDVTKRQRGIGKTINFSIVYGISSYGLSERMKLSRSEAQGFIDAYYKTYPNIYSYLENLKIFASKNKYTETIIGRRRVNNQIGASQFYIRNAAERELLNFVIQGSAADFMKLAMVEISEKVLSKYEDVKLLLQIHDEFLFEVPNEFEKDIFLSEVKSLMENVYNIGVPYKVDAKLGKRWGTMDTIKL